MLLHTPAHAHMQGTASKVVRTGGSGLKAKYVGLAGLGKAAKVGASADWGASCYQVGGWAVRGAQGAPWWRAVGAVHPVPAWLLFDTLITGIFTSRIQVSRATTLFAKTCPSACPCGQALGTALATTAKAQRIKTAAVAALDVPAGHAEAAVAQIAAGVWELW
jgi:hypothetical protein